MATRKAADATREILVILNGGKRRRVSGIPVNAKITYGPVAPGTRDFGGGGGNALRIYTTQNNQLAVFVGVQEFRDLSLTVQEQKVTKRAKSAAERGADGASETSEFEETYEWESVQ